MHFVIIGDGIAGHTAAHRIRRLNSEAKITVVSGESGPLYSACILAHYISGEIKRERVFLKKLADYSREGIRLISNCRAVEVDFEGKRVCLEKGALDYDKLIIATGSMPVAPPMKGKNKDGVFTFKSIRDADGIDGWGGQRAVVVGSGPVGIEITLALKRRGYQVWLVELLDRILPRAFDELPARMIEGILERGGIEVLTREKVLEVEGGKRVTGIITDRRRVGCDTVVLAAGMMPEAFLARGILETGALKGISVNDTLSTNVQNVYACGDCVETRDLVSGQPSLNLLWHNAKWQGEIAGYNAAGIPRIYPGSMRVTGVDLFGTHAVSMGSILDSSDDNFEVIEKTEGDRYKRLILQNGILIGVQAINWTDNMGASLKAIVKKEKVNHIKDLFALRGSLSTSHHTPYYIRI
jgi:NADH oxidase (H2O2-forming)